MSHYESDYESLVNGVVEAGERRPSRAGATRSVFGTVLCIQSLRHGKFPLLTARKMFYKPVLGELAAFLQGATDLKTFKDFGCNYWDANAGAWSKNTGREKDDWDVGQIYGAQWRDWRGNGLDQIKALVSSIRDNPFGRRHLLTTYDPEETYACLPPCHLLAQFNVTSHGELDCLVYMRSVDLCLGLPSDVVLYATLLLLVCAETQLTPGSIIFMMGDTHIYENHVETWRKQVSALHTALPDFELLPGSTLGSFRPEHLEITSYQHGEKLDYTFNV